MLRTGLFSLRAVTSIVAAATLFAVVASSAKANTTSNSTTTAAAVEDSVIPFMTQELSEYAGSTYGPFTNGVWTDPNDTTCWACDDGGPAAGAAAAYVLTGQTNETLYNNAVQSVNTAIAQRQQPNGGFTGPPGDSESEGISTAFYGVEFGTVYYLLAPYLDATTKAAWQSSLTTAANYLVSSGNATWYANGNINLAYTEFFWLAWNATGNSQLQTDYNNSWSFTMNPPQKQFPGCGWITVKAPTQPNDADGEGYFTETGSGGTGFDAYYSMVQLDVASGLYLLSRDQRALDAANMLMNLEMPLVNTSKWILSAGNGSRHPQPTYNVGFQSSGLAALGLEGGRGDLVNDILPELQEEETWYPQGGQSNAPSFRRAFGNDISIIALAAA